MNKISPHRRYNAPAYFLYPVYTDDDGHSPGLCHTIHKNRFGSWKPLIFLDRIPLDRSFYWNSIISGGLSRHSLNYIVMSLVLVLWSPGHNGWDGCNSGQATTILLIMQLSYSLYWTGIHIWLLCLLLLYSPQSVHYNIHTESSYYKCPYACPRWPFIYVLGRRQEASTVAGHIQIKGHGTWQLY